MYDKKDYIHLLIKTFSYILVVIFCIFEVILVIFSPGLWLGYVLSTGEAETISDYIGVDLLIIMIIIIFYYTIPISTTILQWFFNKKFFKIQAIVLFITLIISNIPCIINLLNIIKETVFKV